MQLSNKTISRLWKITLLLVLLLLLATIGLLAVQVRNQPAIGVGVQINKRFFMREEPLGVARISAVLRQGTAVTITDEGLKTSASVQQESTTWYRIERSADEVPKTSANLDIGELTGWVPSDAVTLRE